MRTSVKQVARQARHIRFEPELVVRESSTPKRHEAPTKPAADRSLLQALVER